MDRMLAQQAAVTTLYNAAKALGLKGVGAALIVKDGETIWSPTVVVVDAFQRDPDPSRGSNDTGSNYFAVAAGKLAEMMDTHNNSGETPSRLPKKGELGYRGGVTKEVNGLRLFVCFSGGTADQDVLVSQTALEKLEWALMQPDRPDLIVMITGGHDIA